jgi:hypothetical protein
MQQFQAEVYGYKRLAATSHFQVLTYPEEPQSPLSGTPVSPGMEEMRETAPMEAVGSIIAAGQETQKEVLD